MKKSNVHVRKRLAAFMLCLAFVSMYFSGMPFKQKALAESYYTVDPGTKYQTIDGWGTSLSWWADAVGGWDMLSASGVEKREEIAQLVFGAEGLNLNITRYNLGGGDDPTHTHMSDSRNVPGYKADEDAEYDWNADANQLWMLKRANEIRQEIAGVGAEADIINEFFSVSAPWWMTISGCSSGLDHDKYTIGENLPHDKIDDFIEYFVDVLQYLTEEEGIPFSYAEPLNEPSSGYWVAHASQEGMDVARENHYKYYTALYNELAERGMLNIGLAGLDETATSTTYDSISGATALPFYDLLAKVNTHIYSVDATSRGNIKKLIYSATPDYENQSKKLWMSEICYKGDSNDHDRDMSGGLLIARDIREDLYTMGTNAWIIWQAVETERSNLVNKQGYGLIHGVYSDEFDSIQMQVENLRRGDYFLTKQYYAMGQYSKYIKPGSRIINTDDTNTVAALSPDGSQVVLVIRNNSGRVKEDLNYYVKNFNISSAYKVETSADKAWATSSIEVNDLESQVNVDLDAKSITTIVLNGQYDSAKTNSAFFLNEFEASATDYYVNYRTALSGTLYVAQNPEYLPANGGTDSNNYRTVSLSSAASGNKAFGTFGTAFTENSDVYYGVVETTVGGKKNYSRVLSYDAVSRPVDDRYVYFTGAGKKDRLTFSGVEYGGFGQNNSIADQPFKADMATGKSWGYTNAGADTAVSEANDPLTAGRRGSARSADTRPITYKYEVEQGVDYDVLITVTNPSGTSQKVSVNPSTGTEQTETLSNTSTLQANTFTEVQGVLEGGKYYIVVQAELTTAQSAEATDGLSALVNLIAIRESEDNETPIAITVKDPGPQAIVLGDSLESKLPDNVEALTTQGLQTVAKNKFSVVTRDYSHSGDDYPYVKAICKINDLNLSFDVLFSVDRYYDLYYHVNVGNGTQARDGGLPEGIEDDFEIVKYFNADTLQQSDLWVDRHNRLGNPTRVVEATGALRGDQPVIDANYPIAEPGSSHGDDRSPWGRVYGPQKDTIEKQTTNGVDKYVVKSSQFTWGNTFDGEKTGSGLATSDKWASYTCVSANAREKLTIRYWLPGLTPGAEYVLDLGVYNPEDVSRPMKLRIGGKIADINADSFTIDPANPGVHPELSCTDSAGNPITVTADTDGNPKIDVPFASRYIYTATVTADENGVVDFRLYSTGTQKAVLSWFDLKKPIAGLTPPTETTAKPARLTAPSSVVAYDATELTFGAAEAGAVVILSDNNNRFIAEKTVASAGNITFTGLDLTGIRGLVVRQYKSGVASDSTSMDIPQLTVGNPRSTWSAGADTITVERYAAAGIANVYVKRGENGRESDISAYKYFRAAQNGTYYVRMVTKSGFSITKTVTVNRIDEIHLSVLNDMKEFKSGAYTLKFDTSDSTNAITKVEVTDAAGNYRNITDFKDSDGNYLYTVQDNQILTVAVTSSEGAVKRFSIDVANIDSLTPSVSLVASGISGAPGAVINVAAGSDYTVSVQYNDEAASIFYGDAFPLLKSGRYTFTVTNSVGISASRTINYYSELGVTQMMDIASSQRSDGKVDVTVAAIWDGAVITAARIDGKTAGIAITEGKFTVNENGLYQITAVDSDGNTDIVTFRVNHFATESSTGGYKPGLSAGAAAGITVAAVVVAAGAALGIIFLLAKKKIIFGGK